MSMKLEHIAVWTYQLETMRSFYETYFGAHANSKYVSQKEFDSVFESYFLTFGGGARLEIMTRTGIPRGDNGDGREWTGLTHIAFSVGTAEELDRLYTRLKDDGVRIAGQPRMTGDGYYEACVLDPDGNRVEITVVP